MKLLFLGVIFLVSTATVTAEETQEDGVEDVTSLKMEEVEARYQIPESEDPDKGIPKNPKAEVSVPEKDIKEDENQVPDSDSDTGIPENPEVDVSIPEEDVNDDHNLSDDADDKTIPEDAADEKVPVDDDDQTFADNEDPRPSLERRGLVKKEYKPWSAWKTWSVPKEYKFPHYYQWKPPGFGCPVGCGPVAWAMIFGYYDRLAHGNPSYGYNKNLYRCIDGIAGSPSCIAPPTRTATVKKYILAIRKKVKTFCLFGGGATKPGDMGKIQGFYKARQGGNAKISSYKWAFSWIGWTRAWIRHRARDAIKAKYPAIVGIWVKANNIIKKTQHYAVATKFKSRSRKWRRCVWIFKWICGKWKTQTQERFYLHMGWSNIKNDGWYKITTFSAFVARK